MEELIKGLEPYIAMFTFLVLATGVVIAVYRFTKDPDDAAGKRMSTIEAHCELKHSGVDKDLSSIKTDISSIKNNHLNHIEKDVKRLSSDMVRVLTILEERNRKYDGQKSTS